MKIFTSVYWENKIRKLRYRIQRGRRGWSDRDVQNIYGYFTKTMCSMLRYFRAHRRGHPTYMTQTEWNFILDRMITLLEDMDRNTCSKDFTGINESIDRDQYMVQCKNEFFQLFSQYFYDLWD